MRLSATGRPAGGEGRARTGLPMLGVIFERIRDFRNRKVADPAFRRFAARFPPTRFLARREAKALFDLTAGFVYSQILHACVRLGLFDLLAGGPRGIDEIARRTGLARDAAERLLKAADALDLVERRAGGRYALGRLGAALPGNEGVTAMIAHHAVLYEDLADPVALLRGGRETRLARFWAYGGEAGDVEAEAYSRLMGASQDFVADALLDLWPFGKHRLVLDVGGGDGTFLRSVLARNPGPSAILFDLPKVARIAAEANRAAGLDRRIRIVEGSFLTDPLPEGADLVTLNRVLHDHDDAAAMRLLGAIREAIRPGGTLLLTEPMSDTPGARAAGDAYFGFYLLAMGRGRPRSAERITAMLREAGFARVSPLRNATPLIARTLAARAG